MIVRDLNPIDPSVLDERIRVALVAPHPVQRKRLIHAVRAHQDLDIVGVTPNGQEVMRLCPHIRPDVVVVDTWDAGTDGQVLAGLIQGRWPWVQVLVLGDGPAPHETALPSGPKSAGFLPEGKRDRNVGAAIRALFAQRNGTPGWNTSDPGLRAFPDQLLSQREWEVWQALKMGLNDAQIGERLGVNELTARLHVRNVLDHQGLASRREVAVASRTGRAQSRKARDRLSVPKQRGLAAKTRLPVRDAASRQLVGVQNSGGQYSGKGMH